jgi:hypothetical protein
VFIATIVLSVLVAAAVLGSGAAKLADAQQSIAIRQFPSRDYRMICAASRALSDARYRLTCHFSVCFSVVMNGGWNPVGVRDGCATVSPILVGRRVRNFTVIAPIRW